MCSIAGYKVLDGYRASNAVRVFEAILYQSQIRGKHATGVSWTDGEKVRVVKYPGCAKDFLETAAWIDIRDQHAPSEMIGHCRYSTSGKDHQPVSVPGLSMVHNGLVSMGTQKEFEKQYGVKTATDNDSEIILQKVATAYEDFQLEPVISDFTFADAIAHGLHTVYKVDTPIFACGFLDAQGTVSVVCDHLRPLWFFYIEAWGILGFASTEDIIKRAFKSIKELSGMDAAVWSAVPYTVYTLGKDMMRSTVPILNKSRFTGEKRYRVPSLVVPGWIDNAKHTLRGKDLDLDSPKYSEGDCRVNMREAFKRYSAAAVVTWEIDPNYPLMDYLFKRYELSMSQQYWACFLYGVFYHPGTVFYVMQEFPEYEKVDVGRLEAWHKANWQKLRYNKDRKYEKGHFVEMFLSYRDVIGAQHSDSQERFFEGHFTGEPTDNFHRLWKSLNGLLRFGRYSLFIYTETLARCMGIPIVADTIFLKDSASPRAGLCHVLGKPELAKAKLTKDQWTWLEEELEKLLLEIQEEYWAVGVQMDHWFIESCLCAFKGFFANGRYLGYYLDRMADEILQMSDESLTDGIEWNVLWQFRKESFPWEYLGEYGKPPRLKVQTQWRHTFEETGHMIGMWPCVKRGVLPHLPIGVLPARYSREHCNHMLENGSIDRESYDQMLREVTLETNK